ncbi:MAG: TonB-dependent receptor [Ignavibacteriae bacterium]|nr:MAG: TonB-dependent receptor [Ignavibacteriota bacterium]
MLKNYTGILFSIFIFVSYLYAGPADSVNSSAKIFGKVTDNESRPLYGANIVIENSIDGATTDSSGYFEFETEKLGQQIILFTAIGMKDEKVVVNIESGKSIELRANLLKSEVETDEILVTASSYTSGQNSHVTITPLEIVRIPGSDADLYRALTTFPGANQVDEGSKLTVRGGDANEVLTILDQASLYNPFVFDDDFNSSSYSTVNPWGLRGINFSSGGFSAKYGNALSAVLDLKSYEMPQGTGAFLFWGLANASASGVYLSDKRKFGATFDISTTFLEPYFKINGKLGAEFNPTPLAQGLGGTLSYNFGTASYLKLYANYNFDKSGIRNSSPSYDGYYNSKSKTLFGNLAFSSPLGSRLLFNSGLSYSKHIEGVNYGVLNTDNSEVYTKFRTDLSYQLSRKVNINGGGEYEYSENNFNGTVPLLQYNLRLNAPAIDINGKKISGRVGGYLESQVKLTKSFFVIGGLRTDYHTLSKNAVLDPRFSIGLKFAEDNVVRGAVGIYHQFPSLEYYAQSNNNDLKPEKAIHYILGYEINKMDGLFLFRVEAYYKDYRDLVLQDQNNFLYYSGGKGFAKGVDVFLKSKITNKYSAWISYAYTDSRRRQYSATQQTSANYDITHSLTGVLSYSVNDALTLGASYRISTGKPYTPVTGSMFDSSQSLYIPFYGETNSGRFPTYHRMDVNAQYMFSLFGKFAIAVFQVSNVFNSKNLYGYTYNFDYSKQLDIVSTNRRTVYFALGLEL